MIEKIIECISVYIAIGILFSLSETMTIANKWREGVRFNRIKIIIAWLPAIFSRKVTQWLWLIKEE